MWSSPRPETYNRRRIHVKQAQFIQRAVGLSRQWTRDGQLWVQAASSSPATRAEVQDLLQRFTEELQIRQVCCISTNLQGICPALIQAYNRRCNDPNHDLCMAAHCLATGVLPLLCHAQQISSFTADLLNCIKGCHFLAESSRTQNKSSCHTEPLCDSCSFLLGLGSSIACKRPVVSTSKRRS